MSFKVDLAGYIRDIAGVRIEIPDKIDNTEKLLKYITEQYPLAKKYILKISVNEILVEQTTRFNKHSRILVFNPYAGG